MYRPLMISSALALVSCSARPPTLAQPAEVERACGRVLAILHTDKTMGVSCEVAKLHAQKSEPLCPVAFTCLAPRDGGSE